MEEDFVEGTEHEPSVSARDIARAAAAQAVRGRPADADTAKPGEQFRDRLESEEALVGAFEEGEGGEAPEDVIDTVVDTPEPVVLTADELGALQEVGIDLPVSPDALPVEAQDAYGQLARSALQATREADARVQESQRQALELAEALKDVKTRLSTPEGQTRLLLTLAMTSPEVFSKAAQQIDRMQQDAEYAEIVRRGLEAEARLEAAQRMERAAQASQVQSKGRQIEDHTVRLAKRAGIDESFAKEMVAARILQNEARTGKRDISLQEVNEVVGNLAKRMGKQPAAARTPAAAARQQKAPQKPAAPAGRTPATPPPPPAQRRVDVSDPLDKLRGAIRQSAQNLRSRGV